ncbi:hypothetical protein [Methylobacterium sp. ID0610]|uniref:hypothetical protein n=1 Tax=Methylobacterium carpenticola TaxID=3344827 RepID=UPI00369E8354
MPSFIRMPTWRYAAGVRGVAELPRGFVLDAARQAARWNGYYLFHAWGREQRPRSVREMLADAA